jgi:hypothetical protein
MAATYELRIYDHTGVELSRIALTGTGKVGCSRYVNKPGLLSVWLPGNHAALADLEYRGMVELWRQDLAHGIANHRIFGGLYLNTHWEQPTDAARILLTCPGYPWWLWTRTVAWQDAVTNRTSFAGVPGETILKTLVKYNITSLATVVNSRLRDGTNDPAPYIVVDTDLGAGTTQDLNINSGDKLLDTLTKFAPISGGDWDLLRTATRQWTFYFYPGQRGTDRTSSLTFSLANANMGQPVYDFDKSIEGTVAITGGQGKGADRDWVFRNGADYSASNDIEFFVNATQVAKGNTTGLNAAGDNAAWLARVKQAFGFRIQPNENFVFEKDFDWGDKATAVNAFTGASSNVKIAGMDIALEENGDEVLSGTIETGWL